MDRDNKYKFYTEGKYIEFADYGDGRLLTISTNAPEFKHLEMDGSIVPHSILAQEKFDRAWNEVKQYISKVGGWKRIGY